MRIGYPCMNYTLGAGCTTFRLKSYSETRLIDSVTANLHALDAMLRFNVENGLLMFRMVSQMVPFASHPVCQFDWLTHFKGRFRELGAFIQKHGVRISMHPDQFTLINSPSPDIYQRSVAELNYHAQVMDAMQLPPTGKIQIHVGGLYGDREGAIARFAERYKLLSAEVQRRLVIENDDRLFSLSDCLRIHEAVGVPILFDTFHQEVLPNGMPVKEALRASAKTWRTTDGLPMLDYSSQLKDERRGNHAHSLDDAHFKKFLSGSKGWDGDVILEIKDKEKSAIRAVALAVKDNRLIR